MSRASIKGSRPIHRGSPEQGPYSRASCDYIVGFGFVEISISTNPKPTIYRNLHENTDPGSKNYNQGVLNQPERRNSRKRTRRPSVEQGPLYVSYQSVITPHSIKYTHIQQRKDKRWQPGTFQGIRYRRLPLGGSVAPLLGKSARRKHAQLAMR